MRTPAISCLSCLSAAFLLGISAAQSATINWGTYLSSSSYLFDSSGVPLDDNYYFELGTFGTGFTPTAANMSSWLANWKPFDRASAPSTWNSSTGTVFDTAVLESDFTTSNASLPQVTFAAGEQAYIWVYKAVYGQSSPVPSLVPGYEWALVTNNSTDSVASDDWLMPVPSGHVSTTYDWRIEDANVSIFGGLNDTQGAGGYTITPSAFVLQTHTEPLPVPEPSSALLVAAVGALGFLRRNRNRRIAHPVKAPVPNGMTV